MNEHKSDVGGFMVLLTHPYTAHVILVGMLL